MASFAHALTLDPSFFPMDVVEDGIIGKTGLLLTSSSEELVPGDQPLETLLLLTPFQVSEMAFAIPSEDALVYPEHEMVRDVISLLTTEQQDVLLRVVLKEEAIESVARSHRVVVGDIRLSVSCALDVLFNADVFLSRIADIVKKGRSLGY